MLSLGGPFSSIGVPQTPIKFLQASQFFSLLEPLGSQVSTHGLGLVARGREEVRAADTWALPTINGRGGLAMTYPSWRESGW